MNTRPSTTLRTQPNHWLHTHNHVCIKLGAVHSPPALIKDLCQAFGVSADAVQRVEVMAWSQDPFTRGTYVYLQPGQYAGFRCSLPQTDQRVHFAGAERSSWPTWMEGAVESGEDAADAIIAAAD